MAVLGQADPLKGFIATAKLGTHFVDYPMYCFVLGDCYLEAKDETKAIISVTNGVNHVKSKNAGPTLKQIYVAKINEVGKKYPTSQSKLSQLANQLS